MEYCEMNAETDTFVVKVGAQLNVHSDRQEWIQVRRIDVALCRVFDLKRLTQKISKSG